MRARRIGTLLVRTLVDRSKGGPFSAHRIRLAPGARHAPLHHARTWEFFMVLEGSVSARIGRRRRRFGRGDSAFLRPGVVHQFHAGPRGVEVLAFFSPPLDLDRPDVVTNGRTSPLVGRRPGRRKG